MNITAWFDLKVKPVRVGVYQLQNEHTHIPHYSYWNGLFWCFTCDNRYDALGYSNRQSPGFKKGAAYNPYVAWRGLDKQP
jgi:hypothetical protein